MDDEDVVGIVAEAAGRCARGARVQTLAGRQGLLVCRVTLADGASYVFKAVRECGRPELALTALVARIAPEAAPATLAFEADEARGHYWLVTEDLGPRRLADAPDVAGYLAAAQRLAALQVATMTETAALVAAGVPEVGERAWEDTALRALACVNAQPGGVLGHFRDEIEAVVWSVTDAARCASALPAALVHGDLHAGNIALTDEGAVRLLDWGSAYVGPAFLGIEELLLPAARHLRSAGDLARVRAAYCRAWTPVLGKLGPFEQAAAACRVLAQLALLDESLRRPAHYDAFASAAIAGRLVEVWRQWRKG